MAFNGYLIKKPGNNSTYFPEDLIVASTYQVVPDIRQDKEPTRDLSGLLHRAVVSAKPSTIKFATRELHLADIQRIKNFWSAVMVLAAERKVRVEFWNPDTSSYKTEYMYIPDVTYTIVYHTSNDIIYAPVEYELIGYGN